MRKAVFAPLIALSLIAASAPAFAGVWVNGYYYPYCYWVAGPYGWYTQCY